MTKIDLIYARDDEKLAEELYARLTEAGFRPWMYPRDVPPGVDWQQYCLEVIPLADFYFPLLTNDWKPNGFEYEELKRALEVAKSRKGKIYLIPLRLSKETVIPFSAWKYRWVELWREGGFEELVRAINRAITRDPLPAPKPPEPLVRACAENGCVL